MPYYDENGSARYERDDETRRPRDSADRSLRLDEALAYGTVPVVLPSSRCRGV